MASKISTRCLDHDYYRIEDRFIDSGIPLHLQPPKIHEGPPYDVALIHYMIEQIAEGGMLATMLADDPTLPRRNEFMQYISKRPDLKEAYENAREISGHANMEFSVLAAEGRDKEGSEVMETEQRSKVRSDAYRWAASVLNRKDYGDRKQIDVNQTLDLSDAMRMAEERVARQRERVIRGEVVQELIEVLDDVDDSDDVLKAIGVE
jgi:hypothetical protein